MVTQGWERLCRRLREHHEKLGAAVATRAEGMTLKVFTGWDDGRGRLRVAEISRGWGIDLNLTRELARRLLGPQFLGSQVFELVESPTCVRYVAELDKRPGCPRYGLEGRLRIGEPAAVRWLEARLLAAGIGGDNGRLAWRGRSLEYTAGG